MRKILISAYGCEPDKGSEQGVGWHWVLEMAKTERLWVITRSNNKQSIEKEFPSQYKKNVTFLYYDLPSFFHYLKNKDRGLYFYYTFWQIGIYRLAKKWSREVDFDYCMHLTFGSMWMPTFIHWLSIPFIWGPIGGGESVPFNLIKTLPVKNRLVQYLRYFLIRSIVFNPFFIHASHCSQSILARTGDSKNVFPERYHDKIKIILETGINEEQLQRYEKKNHNFSNDNTVNILYTGRLVAFKNVQLAIMVFSEAYKKNNNIKLWLVGGGDLKPKLEFLTKKLGVYEYVNFLGISTQEEAIERMKKSDIFIFPSLREGGSWSLIEAMAVGLPIVCIESSGMKIITDNTCAIRILPSNPDLIMQQMVEGINKLVDSAQLRKEMGLNGRDRLKRLFLWEQKGIFMQELFDQLDEKKT